MSELLTFIRLGFRHITDLNALDHILFLLALAAIYRPSNWRSALWVITAFTVGHSVTLALAVTGLVKLPTDIIEFLIPVTIVATCIENIYLAKVDSAPRRGGLRPLLAGMFGLIHGAGFANYLRDLFVDRVAVPLLGFNIGIEIGQLVVLTIIGLLLLAVDYLLSKFVRNANRTTLLRARIAGVSILVLIVALQWSIERQPW